MTEPNTSHQETLDKLLSENGLTLESRFYRAMTPALIACPPTVSPQRQ
jgi:hypothetical protein